jgi:hypothetical protein
MAEVIVQNLRYPTQIITIIVTIKREIVFTDDPSKLQWILEASTKAKDQYGQKVSPSKLYKSYRETLTKDINDLITDLCKKVDWTHIDDHTPPELASRWPYPEEQNIPVNSTIMFNLWEEPPSSGIDFSSIRVKIKGFDLTDKIQITGDMTRCSVSLTPGTKYQSAVKVSAN